MESSNMAEVKIAGRLVAGFVLTMLAFAGCEAITVTEKQKTERVCIQQERTDC